MKPERWLFRLFVCLTLVGVAGPAFAQAPEPNRDLVVEQRPTVGPGPEIDGEQEPEEAPAQEVEVEVVELADIGAEHPHAAGEHPNAGFGQPPPDAGHHPESGPPQQRGGRGNALSTFEGVYMLYGISGAFQTQNGETGLAIGVEVSRVYMSDHLWWYGAYADLRYTSLVQGIDLSVGFEGGWTFFGFDAGVYAQLASQSAIGLRARGCLTSGIVSFCGGGGFTQRGGFAEVNFLLKFPGSQDRS